MRKFSKYELNLSTSLLYKIATCAIGILIPRLFILSYGSEVNGLQGSIAEFFIYITLIEAGVGSASVQALFGPIARQDFKAANGILSATTYFYNKIGLYYFMLLLALATLYPAFVHVGNLSYLTIFLYIFFAGAATGLNFFFQSKVILILRANGDVYFENLFLLASFLLSSTIKIILILSEQSIVFIQLSYFLISLLVMFGYYLLVKKKYSWVNFHTTPNIAAISQKNSVLVHRISSLVFNNTDIILLTFICGLKVVSLYTMYKMVINMVRALIASFVDSFDYKLGQAFQTETRAYYCKMVDSFNICYSIFSFALFTVASILLLPFMRLYTDGMDMNYIFPLLPYLYVIIEALQIGREAMTRTSIVAGHFKKTLNQAIIEMFINLGFTIGFMFLFKHIWNETAGLYGALLGTISALAYRTFAMNAYSNHVILERSVWETNKIMLVNFILYALVSFVSVKVDWSFLSSYVHLIIAGAFLFIIIFTFYVAVHSLTSYPIMKMVFIYVRKKI